MLTQLLLFTHVCVHTCYSAHLALYVHVCVRMCVHLLVFALLLGKVCMLIQLLRSLL
jgi:hypothetical protein